MQVDEQEPVTSLQVAAKSWKKENIDGIPKDEEEEEVDDNKDLPTGFWLLDPIKILEDGLVDIEREINNLRK